MTVRMRVAAWTAAAGLLEAGIAGAVATSVTWAVCLEDTLFSIARSLEHAFGDEPRTTHGHANPAAPDGTHPPQTNVAPTATTSPDTKHHAHDSATG